MALINLTYVLVLLPFIKAAPVIHSEISRGLFVLTQTPSIVMIEGVWVLIFLYVGRSSVTAAKLSFQVLREKI